MTDARSGSAGRKRDWQSGRRGLHGHTRQLKHKDSPRRHRGTEAVRRFEILRLRVGGLAATQSRRMIMIWRNSEPEPDASVTSMEKALPESTSGVPTDVDSGNLCPAILPALRASSEAGGENDGRNSLRRRACPLGLRERDLLPPTELTYARLRRPHLRRMPTGLRFYFSSDKQETRR